MRRDWTRRGFLKTLTAGTVLAATGRAARAADTRPPNVVIILSDDQGAVDVGCYGASDLQTPSLDALAARGLRFTQFYVAAPVCSPSRAALLTGRYPQRAGLDTNAGGKTGLPSEQTTIAEVFKAAGYHTGIFGKWHLGMLPEMSPLAQGFDEFFGHKEGCIDNYSHFFYWSGPNRHDLWRNDAQVREDGAFFPDLVVREACRFLEENRDNPFLLYLPFNMPHYPLQGEERFSATQQDPNAPRGLYAAFVGSLDDKIGKVLAKLDALGLRENTIVVFLSDNGHSVEERAFFGGGSAGIYRGHKFTLWEGGIRLPCIISWPGRVPEGEVRDQVTCSIDWLPTLAHYCGVEIPAEYVDGADIGPVIASQDAPSPHTVLHWMLRDQWAVREGDWKLVVNGAESVTDGHTLPLEPLFLGNLREDASETVNLAFTHPEIVERLSQLHERWLDDLKQP